MEQNAVSIRYREIAIIQFIQAHLNMVRKIYVVVVSPEKMGAALFQKTLEGATVPLYRWQGFWTENPFARQESFQVTDTPLVAVRGAILMDYDEIGAAALYNPLQQACAE